MVVCLLISLTAAGILCYLAPVKPRPAILACCNPLYCKKPPEYKTMGACTKIWQSMLPKDKENCHCQYIKEKK